MSSKLAVCAALALATAALAKDRKAYQSGKLFEMDSVPCGTSEKDAQSLTGQMLGTDCGRQKTQEVRCQKYVLEAQRVIYRIRPRDQKHPVPVGEPAQFRLQKDKMLLRVEDGDGKQRECVVLSMMPRSDSSTADGSISPRVTFSNFP
jgi:hypothetical protein